jgi:hypothetical protein
VWCEAERLTNFLRLISVEDLLGALVEKNVSCGQARNRLHEYGQKYSPANPRFDIVDHPNNWASGDSRVGGKTKKRYCQTKCLRPTSLRHRVVWMVEMHNIEIRSEPQDAQKADVFYSSLLQTVQKIVKVRIRTISVWKDENLHSKPPEQRPSDDTISIS